MMLRPHNLLDSMARVVLYTNPRYFNAWQYVESKKYFLVAFKDHPIFSEENYKKGLGEKYYVQGLNKHRLSEFDVSLTTLAKTLIKLPVIVFVIYMDGTTIQTVHK